MARLEERLASVEGRVHEQSQMFALIRDSLARLEQRVDGRFDAVDRRFEAVDRRLDAIDRHFVWMVGIQVTSVLTLMGVVLSRS